MTHNSNVADPVAVALARMERDLRDHLEALVKRARKRWFGRTLTYTARGTCNWCAKPYLRRMEHPENTVHPPVLYCSASHSGKASARRAAIAEHADACPTKNKRTFISEALAAAEVGNYRFAQHLRVYLCNPGCHGWHITKSPLR